MATITLTPTACTSAVNQWVVLYNYLTTNSSYYPRQFIFTYPTNADLASDGANITSVTIHGYVRNGNSAQKQLRVGFRTSASAGANEWASIDGSSVLEGSFIAIEGWDHSDYGYAKISRTFSGDGVFAKWIKQQFKAGQQIYMGVIQPQSGKSISTNTTLSEWTIDVEYELLGNIPTVDKTSVKLGENVTTTINRVIDDSVTTLNYKIGDTVLSSANIGTATSHTFTVPTSAGSYFPTSPTTMLTIEAVTTVSGVSYGSISVTSTVTLPDDAKPSLTLASQSRQWIGSATRIDAYVQNQSGYVAVLSNTTMYGASVSSLKGVCEGNELTRIQAGFRYKQFTGSGEIASVFTITDTRGLTGTLTITNTVLPWAAPTIQSFTVQRATDAGVVAIDGTCAMIEATATASSLLVSDVEKNSLAFKVQYRRIGDTDWTDTDAITTSSISTSISGLLTSSGTIVNSFDDMTGYEFKLSVSDLYGTGTALDEMPTKEQFWDIDESTGHMGFGGDAPTTDENFSYRFHEPVDFAGGYKVYSTQEVNTGNTWIDGTAIYRVCIETSSSVVNNQEKVATLPNAIKVPISIRAFVQSSDGNTWRPVPAAYHGSMTWTVNLYINGTDVYMAFGSSWTGTKKIILIIEYTKS